MPEKIHVLNPFDGVSGSAIAVPLKSWKNLVVQIPGLSRSKDVLAPSPKMTDPYSLIGTSIGGREVDTRHSLNEDP